MHLTLAGVIVELPLIIILIKRGEIMPTIERTLELWNFISMIKPDCNYYHIAIGTKPYLSAILRNDFSEYDEECCICRYRRLDRIYRFANR